jgi:muramidase (phage lysozyme)
VPKIALPFASLLASPNVRAAIRVIREGETWNSRNPGDEEDEKAFRVRYHPTIYPCLFDGFDDHPRILEPLKDGSGRKSSAAGAPQITMSTWDDMRARYEGIGPQFTPQEQLKCCVALMHAEDALDDVIAGRFDAWLPKLATRWASLPNSPLQDGGRKLTYVHALATWKRFGGGELAVVAEAPPEAQEQPAAPIEDRSVQARPDDIERITAAETPRPLTMEAPMAAPLLIPLVTMLGQLIPSLAALFGKDGEKIAAKTAAATKAIEIVTTAVGAMNGQDAVEKIAADPAKLAAAQAALFADPMIGGMLTEIGGGIAAAHQRAVDPAQPPFWKNPAFWVSMLLLPMAYYVVVAVIGVPLGDGKFVSANVTQDVRSMVIGGVMGSVLGGIVAFWLGTNYGSSRKTDMIASGAAR